MSNTPNIELLHIDCMEYMATLPDKAFELAIVDPPYGIGVNHSMGRRKGDAPSDYKKAYWDNASPDAEYFTELFRVSNNQIIWGANHFISKMPKDSSCWILWDKMFSEGVSFAQFEMAWTSFDTVCKKFTKDPKSQDRIHPTQKPVALYRWLLHNYAKPGDRILDTHGGSRSLAIACHQMGFDHVSCELDADYHRDSVKRFKEQTMQQSLFK